MREKGSWSSATFTRAASEAKSHGGATHLAEQRARAGKGLDPLVDPKGHGTIRLALNLLVPDGGEFVLKAGVAMPVKTDLDTTGSMGGNVELAFASLPRVFNLLAQGPNAVLRRYNTQIATGVVQDKDDNFPYQVSQFEPDNEIDRQMGMLVPERSGGDAAEDYQLGLYSTACLTRTSIVGYGLKGYYFSVGDEQGRDQIALPLLKRIFGEEHITERTAPDTAAIAEKLLKSWHGFYLQVGAKSSTTKWWSKMLGKERVIRLPRTEDLAEVQACVIGLTEGVLDLRTAADYLVGDGGIDKARAKAIVQACAHIPVGAQAEAENFDRVPLAGARFAKREDLWPIEGKTGGAAAPESGGIKWKK